MTDVPDEAPRLVRKSSGEQAALYIRRLIFDGQLRPGTRVPQDEIAEALGISRIPVREALVALEREGWITIEMHRGAFVNALTEEIVEDHFELLGAIYRFAMERALSRGGGPFVERLAGVGGELARSSDPAVAGPLLREVFAAIAEAADAPRLRVVLRSISTLVPGDFFAALPGAVDLERRSMGAVVAAVRRGDAERAGDELARMLRKVGKQVVVLFRQRGLFDTADDGRSRLAT